MISSRIFSSKVWIVAGKQCCCKLTCQIIDASLCLLSIGFSLFSKTSAVATLCPFLSCSFCMIMRASFARFWFEVSRVDFGLVNSPSNCSNLRLLLSILGGGLLVIDNDSNNNCFCCCCSLCLGTRFLDQMWWSWYIWYRCYRWCRSWRVAFNIFRWTFSQQQSSNPHLKLVDFTFFIREASQMHGTRQLDLSRRRSPEDGACGQFQRRSIPFWCVLLRMNRCCTTPVHINDIQTAI